MGGRTEWEHGIFRCTAFRLLEMNKWLKANSNKQPILVLFLFRVFVRLVSFLLLCVIEMFAY